MGLWFTVLAGVGRAQEEAGRVLKAALRSLGFVLTALGAIERFHAGSHLLRVWDPDSSQGKETGSGRHCRVRGSLNGLGMTHCRLPGTASSVTTLSGSSQ